MSMELTITLAGGARVDAAAQGFTIHTDQPATAGGDGSAPDPFTLFLASIGTCAGFYVGSFCRTRGIPTAGIRLVQQVIDDPATRRPRDIKLQIYLPASFPAEYRDAVVRAAGTCKVKKVLADPPAFEITAIVDGVGAVAASQGACTALPGPRAVEG